ncbi:MAG: DNA alkylation repair protein [Pseudomonadota bacterium]
MSLEDIQTELKRHSDPAHAAALQRFFKTAPGQYGAGDVFRGIRVPAIRAIARKYRHTGLADIEALQHSRFHEDRLLALLLLVARYQTSETAAQQQIYRMYCNNLRWINNWDLVDASAPYIVGHHLYARGKKPLRKWLRSKNLWERRIAVMAGFYFIRQNRFDVTFAAASVLLDDPEDLIHKAVGWMLREIGKRDRAALEAFLRSHYDRMPRTMLRYAIEKFPEALRRRYLRGEIA